MAFNCVSRVGLTISGGYVPKELQELIANFWLSNRYRDECTWGNDPHPISESKAYDYS